MPMIDVYAANDLFPSGTERQLGEELTFALLRGLCQNCAKTLLSMGSTIYVCERSRFPK